MSMRIAMPQVRSRSVGGFGSARLRHGVARLILDFSWQLVSGNRFQVDYKWGRDIREFIARLEGEGDARRIEEEVDWNLEVGAMTRRSSKLGLPAPLFQKIKEYSQEYGLFSEALNTYGRIAIAMEMDANTSVEELIKEYSKRKQSSIKPI